MAWGERLPGVLVSLAAGREQSAAPGPALTPDACGGKRGASPNAEAIAFLRERKIPARLFVTSLWIRANPEATADPAAHPLFGTAARGARLFHVIALSCRPLLFPIRLDI